MQTVQNDATNVDNVLAVSGNVNEVMEMEGIEERGIIYTYNTVYVDYTSTSVQ